MNNCNLFRWIPDTVLCSESLCRCPDVSGRQLGSPRGDFVFPLPYPTLFFLPSQCAASPSSFAGRVRRARPLGLRTDRSHLEPYLSSSKTNNQGQSLMTCDAPQLFSFTNAVGFGWTSLRPVSYKPTANLDRPLGGPNWAIFHVSLVATGSILDLDDCFC
jgi:hypothetical protein